MTFTLLTAPSKLALNNDQVAFRTGQTQVSGRYARKEEGINRCFAVWSGSFSGVACPVYSLEGSEFSPSFAPVQLMVYGMASSGHEMLQGPIPLKPSSRFCYVWVCLLAFSSQRDGQIQPRPISSCLGMSPCLLFHSDHSHIRNGCWMGPGVRCFQRN